MNRGGAVDAASNRSKSSGGGGGSCSPQLKGIKLQEGCRADVSEKERM